MHRLLAVIPLIGGVYFVAKRAFPYFVISADSYGPYFWPRVGFLLPHVVFGVLAITLGGLQFSRRIRQRSMGVHRLCGRAYLLCVLLSGIASFLLVTTSKVTLTYAVGLGSLGIIWIVASSMGLLAVRRGNLRQHVHWMVRSYVLTFAFPLFRLIEELLDVAEIGTKFERLELAAWVCWAVPLFVTEVLLQRREACAVSERRGGGSAVEAG